MARRLPVLEPRLPAVRSKRPQIADSDQARQLLAALPPKVALWAILFFAGLRIGEARALRWHDVDFDADVVRVEHGSDEIDGSNAKTDAGDRLVPVIGEFRACLMAHKLATGRGENDLCFGRTAHDPFVGRPSALTLCRMGLEAGQETRQDSKGRSCSSRPARTRSSNSHLTAPGTPARAT